MRCFFTVLVVEPTMVVAVAVDTALQQATRHPVLVHKQSAELLVVVAQQETVAVAQVQPQQVAAQL
jgi:hypothetical protein